MPFPGWARRQARIGCSMPRSCFMNGGTIMHRRNIMLAVAFGAAVLAGVWASGALNAQQPGFKRTELQRHDLGTPGREVVQARAEFDTGASIGKHTHPGEEFGYILEGSLEFEIAGKPNATLKAGDAFFIPPETVHAAKNVGKGDLRGREGEAAGHHGGEGDRGVHSHEVARHSRDAPGSGPARGTPALAPSAPRSRCCRWWTRNGSSSRAASASRDHGLRAGDRAAHLSCQHVVLTGSESRVEDSRSDPRFPGHPAVQAIIWVLRTPRPESERLSGSTTALRPLPRPSPKSPSEMVGANYKELRTEKTQVDSSDPRTAGLQ